MINFYGVFQLVRVTKEDVTTKGDKVVYFTAAAKRGEDQTDFKFFKMYGSNAESMIRNLQKDDKGNYKSRKLMLDGYVKTYTENKVVECEVKLKPGMIPAQLGELYKDIKVKAQTTIKIEKDCYIVRSMTFVDKKNEMDVQILLDDKIDEVVINDKADTQQSKPITTKTEAKKPKANSRKNSQSNTLTEALNALDGMKNISEMQ